MSNFNNVFHGFISSTIIIIQCTVLCKSNASEMCEFRSLSKRTFQENFPRKFTRKFEWQFEAFWAKFPQNKERYFIDFSVRTIFHDCKDRFTNSVPEISLLTDTIILHTIHFDLPVAKRSRSIHKLFNPLPDWSSVTNRKNENYEEKLQGKLTTSEDFEFSFIPEETKHKSILIGVVVRYQLCRKLSLFFS